MGAGLWRRLGKVKAGGDVQLTRCLIAALGTGSSVPEQICGSPATRARRGAESPREFVEREGGGLRGGPGEQQHGPGDRTAKEQRKQHKWGWHRAQGKVCQRGLSMKFRVL